MPEPHPHHLACICSLLAVFISAVRGNEVYLSRITIFTTHDRFFPPTVYFQCPDDDRAQRYFTDVKATNHTYIVHPESVALTHITSEYCQSDCGIYDRDLFDEDDLFGNTFKLCDGYFDTETQLYTITIPGEFTLELFCPRCNPYVSPPPPSEVPIAAGGEAPASAPGNDDGDLDDLFKGDKARQALILIILLAVFTGFFFGFLVHRCYRAFSDVAAEDARTRFQALYADPNTEIEDLPQALPGQRSTGLVRFARSIRRILNRDSQPRQQQTAIRPGDAVPFHQLKVQEEVDIPDES